MAQLESNLCDLTRQAEGGDAVAEYRLGVLFLLGEGVKQDIEMAYRWLARAAVAQHSGAQSMLPLVASLKLHASAKGQKHIAARWSIAVGQGILHISRKVVRSARIAARFTVSMLTGALRTLPAPRLGSVLAESGSEERRRQAPFVDAA